jgi:hypothetical protein
MLDPLLLAGLGFCWWDRAGEPSSDNGAPHLRPNPVGHGACRGRTSSGGREKAPPTQNPLEPSAPTLNPMPNRISVRVTRSPGHKRLTGRCSELSGGVTFSDHNINLRQPVR